MSNSPIPRNSASDWETNARVDAFYSILTSPDKRAGWDESSFFAAGEDEIGRVFAFMESASVLPSGRSRFVDFGCGVGRNTRALMKRFDAGIGVDISQTMVSMAKQFAIPDQKAASYVENSAPDIAFVSTGSVDFVYSHIVLQHIAPSVQIRYIEEFVRVLAPGGIAAFQIITDWHAPTLVRVAKRMLTPYLLGVYKHMRNDPIRMEMNRIPAAEVLRRCGPANRAMIAADPYTNSTDPSHGGRIVFLSRQEAICNIDSRATSSDFLSQFFFVRKLPL